MMTTAAKGIETSAIGSLPHHNLDAALEFSFRLSIPFLPQIPIRNSWEYMIPQALEGLPGLSVESDGTALLDEDVWQGRSRAFNEKLLNAFASSARPEAFEAFEPSSASASAWQPFLWELEERSLVRAKIQITGPLTAQWALRTRQGQPVDRLPELSTQVYRLVLARALAMARRLQSGGVKPLVFLDEPGLYGFSATNPRHALGLQELRLLVQALRKEGAEVGLHCCSDTDWRSVLSLGLDFLSLDAGLSLKSLLGAPEALLSHLDAGGRLALGIVPTPKAPGGLARLRAEELLAHLIHAFREGWRGSADSREGTLVRVLSDSLYTPACGLALHSVQDAEAAVTLLEEIRDLSQRDGGAARWPSRWS